MKVVLELVAGAVVLLCAQWWGIVAYDAWSRVEPVPGEWRLRERARFVRRLAGVLVLILARRWDEALTELHRMKAWLEGYKR